MGNSKRTYTPPRSVVAVRVRPVSVCWALTRADCTTAPLGSTTVPRILPVICCAEICKQPSVVSSTQTVLLRPIMLSLTFSSLPQCQYGLPTERARFCGENSPQTQVG